MNKVFISATRPNTNVLSHALIFGDSKSAFSDIWQGNVSILRADGVADSDKLNLSYQTAIAGYGYTQDGGILASTLPYCY
jgi:hypothetical protein